MPDFFVCEQCGGEFEKGWTDDEASAEYEAEFGSLSTGDVASVCDDCYKVIMGERAE